MQDQASWRGLSGDGPGLAVSLVALLIDLAGLLLHPSCW